MTQDERDNFKRQNEKLERENFDLKKQVDTYQAKEDRVIQQYERLMDQLKAEIKDKEREAHLMKMVQVQ